MAKINFMCQNQIKQILLIMHYSGKKNVMEFRKNVVDCMSGAFPLFR